MWFLGAASHRLMRAGRVPVPAGLLGISLMVFGMAMRHVRGESGLDTNAIIAVGAALAIACRQLAAFSFAGRFFGWAAGFSYTLYAIHFPLVLLAASLYQRLGFQLEAASPRWEAFAAFALTTAICLLAAYFVSRATERKTGQLRAALLRLCAPLPYRGAINKEPVLAEAAKEAAKQAAKQAAREHADIVVTVASSPQTRDGRAARPAQNAIQ